MNKLIWTFQILLCLFFLMPAFSKLATPKAKLVETKMLSPDQSAAPIHILGVLELLGCIGIILPVWRNIAPSLTPITAVAFCLVMAGAFAFHFSRGEYKMLPVMVVVFTLSALVAWYRFKIAKR